MVGRGGSRGGGRWSWGVVAGRRAVVVGGKSSWGVVVCPAVVVSGRNPNHNPKP